MMAADKRIHARAIGLDLSAGFVGEMLPGRLCGASEADRAKKSILRDGGISENFGETSLPDATLKFHLPESILRMDIAESVQRIQLGRREDVGNRVRVSHDLDRPGDARDGDLAVRCRQRLPQIEIRCSANGGDNQQKCRDQSDQDAPHARIIRQRR